MMIRFAETFSTVIIIFLTIFFAFQFCSPINRKDEQILTAEDDEDCLVVDYGNNEANITEVDAINSVYEFTFASVNFDELQEESIPQISEYNEEDAQENENEEVIENEFNSEELPVVLDVFEENDDDIRDEQPEFNVGEVENNVEYFGEMFEGNGIELEQHEYIENDYGQLVQVSENEYVDQEEEEETVKIECSICFNSVKPDETAFLTNCGHWYHLDTCFMPWYDIRQDCPKCRNEVSDSRNDESLGYWDGVLIKPLEKVRTEDLFDYFRYLVVNDTVDAGHYIQVIGYLVSFHGWDVNTKFENGQTLLIFSVLNNNLDAVMALVHMGAEKDIEDDSSVSASVYALSLDNQEIYEYLIQN